MTELLDVLYSEREKRTHREEAEHLSTTLKEFVLGAWLSLKPDEEFIDNWHLDAICEHLEAVSKREILRLQIWVPPVSMKTMIVSVMWPAWEWTRNPFHKYWTSSYETGYAGQIAAMSRDLMMGQWYRARWGDRFSFTRDGERFFTNDRGGTRISTSPESTRGTGYHGHTLIFDDPIDAGAADASSRSRINATNDWYDGVTASRGIGNDHARVIVMQRLHEEDLAGHVLEAEPWEVLCLPERFECDHPHVWPKDPREEGDLLWPAFRNAQTSKALAERMLSFRAAAQLQQRPAAREGEILKRHWWRFYDPKLFRDEKLKDRRPRFRTVVQSVDTPLKDKESNDLVAIQAWGVVGGDRYLLDLKKGHMNYSQAKRAILEQARYVRSLYKGVSHHCLIENAGYGVELILELKRELTGVTKITRGNDGDKILRAESASADLESGNCFLPGFRTGSDEFSMPDEKRCPADIVDFIDSCAMFPNARNDDDVDAWSQCMNWLRSRTSSQARTWSSFKSRKR